MLKPFSIMVLVIMVIITLIWMGVFLVLSHNLDIQAYQSQFQLQQTINKSGGLTAENQLRYSQNLVAINNLQELIVIFYDLYGQPISSNLLQDNLLNYVPRPEGIAFTQAKNSGQYKFLWKIKTGLNLASYIKAYPTGYILTAKSVRYLQLRQSTTTIFSYIGWIGSVLLTAIIWGVFTVLNRTKGEMKTKF